MAHINSIGAGMYSDLAVSMTATPPTFSGLSVYADFSPLFATEIQSVGGTKGAGTFVRIKNVREFPAMGIPPNVVNVPTYGQPTTQQIQGQSDAPTMEITLNFVPSEWAKEAGCLLGNAVGDGNQYVFRFSLLNSNPTSYVSTAGGLGSVKNSQWFWVGKMDALLVTPQLNDANTATITMTLQSALFGAFSVGT
jgi:hypothetical protein